MKTILCTLLTLLSLYTTSAFAVGENLDGNYDCKKGFLGFTVIDHLAAQHQKDGSLTLDMEGKSFNISKKCNLLNNKKIKSSCDSTTNKITLTQKTTNQEITTTTTLTFEKLRGMVIVKTDKISEHHHEEVVLICHSI